MTGGRFVIDTSKCIGCKACQVACQQWNSLTAEDTAFTGSYQNPPDLSGVNLNIVKFKEAEVEGQIKWLFFKDQCRHCDSPACKLACRKFAIEQLSGGIVRIDPTKCVPEGPNACSGAAEKPCQIYCPFHVPKFRYVKNGSPQLQATMTKCHLCYNRFNNSSLPAASRKPACMVACPTGVMTIGPADSMWTKAEARVETLKNQGYLNARIYPYQQGTAGETHVIWILTDVIPEPPPPPIVTLSLIPSYAISLSHGSDLDFYAVVQNNTDQVQVFQFATKVTLPNGKMYPHPPPSGFLVGPIDVTLNPNESKVWLETQTIPFNAPFGTYTYHGYVGLVGPPRLVYDRCQFNFEVVP